MHISLDGFVAGPKGEMDWIKVDQEIFDHVGRRISKGDTALYGRVTYQMMESYWPGAGSKPGASRHDIEHSAWYSKVHKIVLSKTLRDEGLANTTIISEDIPGCIQAIKQSPGEGGKEMLIFGSPSATHSLIGSGLVDGYWLFVNPVILGHGIPLFTGIEEKTRLQLLNTKQFACGVTELDYTVER